MSKPIRSRPGWSFMKSLQPQCLRFVQRRKREAGATPEAISPYPRPGRNLTDQHKSLKEQHNSDIIKYLSLICTVHVCICLMHINLSNVAQYFLLNLLLCLPGSLCGLHTQRMLKSKPVMPLNSQHCWATPVTPGKPHFSSSLQQLPTATEHFTAQGTASWLIRLNYLLNSLISTLLVKDHACNIN